MAAFQNYDKKHMIKKAVNELRSVNFADILSQLSLDFIWTKEDKFISDFIWENKYTCLFSFTQVFMLLLSS